ncbi:hypothetical protein C2E23DRAFT_154110 [Lenzites betulinus]|nr:hypothetical protein C2E23DRAFT_154110 [Lenzites betulinus]
MSTLAVSGRGAARQDVAQCGARGRGRSRLAVPPRRSRKARRPRACHPPVRPPPRPSAQQAAITSTEGSDDDTRAPRHSGPAGPWPRSVHQRLSRPPSFITATNTVITTCHHYHHHRRRPELVFGIAHARAAARTHASHALSPPPTPTPTRPHIASATQPTHPPDCAQCIRPSCSVLRHHHYQRSGGGDGRAVPPHRPRAPFTSRTYLHCATQ